MLLVLFNYRPRLQLQIKWMQELHVFTASANVADTLQRTAIHSSRVHTFIAYIIQILRCFLLTCSYVNFIIRKKVI